MINLLSTISNSRFDSFFPAAWDLGRWEACVGESPDAIFERQNHWRQEFGLQMAGDVSDFNVMMGHELAAEIKKCRVQSRKLALILPAGPMGMYRWTCYFLSEWDVSCGHVFGFSMDEWSDKEGKTVPAEDPRSFQSAITNAFYRPLGGGTVPKEQRFFATREMLPEYPDRINNLCGEGAKFVVVYGIGRTCHIAFWEPYFGEDFDTDEQWREQSYRIGAALHPMTIEQNAFTSFKSRTTHIPAFANTIGPGLFTRADYAIGGADGVFGRGMQWQGLSLWVTLRHPVTRHVPSTWMTQSAGTLYFTRALAGPLESETN